MCKNNAPKFQEETLHLETNPCSPYHKDGQWCPRVDTKAQKERIQKGYVNSPKHCPLNKCKQRRSHKKGHHAGERWGTRDCGTIETEARRPGVLNTFEEGKMMKHIQWTQQNIPGDSSESIQRSNTAARPCLCQESATSSHRAWGWLEGLERLVSE